MAWIGAISLGDLPEGSMAGWEYGDWSLLLCNHEGEVRAMDGICPHVNGPLAQGHFEGGRVVCPWHAWEFDTATGQCTHLGGAALRKYEVEVREGMIYVLLPESRA